MREVCRFFGIAIAMLDDCDAEFQAMGADWHISVGIYTGAVKGRCPPRALGLVLEWRERHQSELAQNWAFLREGRGLFPIAPLE